jgi:hypothetical protein
VSRSNGDGRAALQPGLATRSRSSAGPPLRPVSPGFDGPVAGGGPIALEPNSGGPGRPIDSPPVIAGDQPLGPPLQPAPPQAPVPEPPPQAAVVFVPTCWGVKTPVVAVGEPGEIELNIRSCQTGPLPASIFAALASESADVSVAGPIDGTKEEAAQSWTWKVAATKAGRHDLEFAVHPAGLQSYRIKTPIVVSEAKEPDDDGLMKALSTSNSALNSLAGGLASLVTIVTTLGTIVALRRTRSKKDGAAPAPEAPQSGVQPEAPDGEPPSDDATVASLGTSAGRPIERTHPQRRHPRSRP